MEGTYISNNTEPVLEGPSSVDTLFLNRDGTFRSGSWGPGEYEINGDNIHFKYEYSHGKANYHSTINRYYFIGTPRILLNSDLGFYYTKTD